MQEINAWLQNGRDFNTGAELYNKYGDNSFLKKLLLSEPTPYTKEKLEAELEALASAQPAIQTDIEFTKIEYEAPVQPDQVEPEKVTVDPKQHARYLSLLELKKNTYRQLENNMVAMRMSSDQSFLHVTAKQILALHSKISEIYRLIDYYDQNGSFPLIKIQEAVVRTPAEEIQLLRVRISRAKGRLKAPNCRDEQKTLKLIEANRNRIAVLMEMLKAQ